MSYEFREWREGDWIPERFNTGSYVLIFNSEQVAATFGSPFNVMKIEVRPKGKGHGTEFIRRLIDNARRINQKDNRNGKYIQFSGVLGDSSEDRKALEHILSKLGFKNIGNENWILPLN